MKPTAYKMKEIYAVIDDMIHHGEDFSEFKRLVRELRGYMRIYVHDGTDRDGRKYALDALEKLHNHMDGY